MISAQEAFEGSMKTLAPIDTSDVIQLAAEKIAEAIESGYFAAYVPPSVEVAKYEKAAAELTEKYGYSASVIQANQILVDGKAQYAVALSINWKFIPTHTRESYNHQ